ncbi:MAG: hypothetical protein Q7L07_15400 [Pseudohongiella sp.]|nr:hypothetical protein [Pseudohongiella sp.]
MQISRDEAAQALADIRDARGRVNQLHGYSDAAPFLILWGLIWLVANSTTQFAPDAANMTWLTGIIAGSVLTVVLATAQARQRGSRDISRHNEASQMGARLGMTQGVVLVFFIGLMAIVWPFDARQFNALISLFWACAYMAAGIWIGMRLFWIGAITTAAILFGYFSLEQYYALWMGLAGGGSLIAGGLWLRRV